LDLYFKGCVFVVVFLLEISRGVKIFDTNKSYETNFPRSTLIAIAVTSLLKLYC
jgi:hypothetical protein